MSGTKVNININDSCQSIIHKELKIKSHVEEEVDTM